MSVVGSGPAANRLPQEWPGRPAETPGLGGVSDPGRARVAPALVEALGYTGGAVVTAALVILIGQFWDSVPDVARVLLALALSIVLLVVGALVPVGTSVAEEWRRAAQRLQSVVWAAGCVALAGAVLLAGNEVFEWEGDATTLAAAVIVALVAGALWLLRQVSLQQVVFYVALTVAVVTGLVMVLEPNDPYLQQGSWQNVWRWGIWSIAALWMVLAYFDLIRPTRTAWRLGAAGLVLGATAMAEGWMQVVVLLVVAGVVALSVWRGDFVMLVFGTIGVLWTLPRFALQLLPGSLAMPLVLLLVGGLLIGAAVVIARTKGRFGSPTHDRDVSSSPPQGT